MHGIKKSNQETFPCHPRDVCRIEAGGTNPYMKNDRAIEDFLKQFEPRYNRAVQDIRDRKITASTISSIAGFMSQIVHCTPTAARLGTPYLQEVIRDTVTNLEKAGEIPRPPPELGSTSLSEMISSGSVCIDVDQKFPQALGATNLEETAQTYGNSYWEILINRNHQSPFFSSDFPVVPEQQAIIGIGRRLFPITPDIAVRVTTDPLAQKPTGSQKFPHFRCNFLECSMGEVRRINQQIVRCADSLIFFCQDLDWIPRFVTKNSNYRIVGKAKLIRGENGMLIVTTHVVERVTH